MITAYAPCGSAVCKTDTYYQQQVRYIVGKSFKTNPKEMFREDLLTQLRKWRARGDRALFMMDVHKDLIDGAMCKQPK